VGLLIITLVGGGRWFFIPRPGIATIAAQAFASQDATSLSDKTMPQPSKCAQYSLPFPLSHISASILDTPLQSYTEKTRGRASLCVLLLIGLQVLEQQRPDLIQFAGTDLCFTGPRRYEKLQLILRNYTLPLRGELVLLVRPTDRQTTSCRSHNFIVVGSNKCVDAICSISFTSSFTF
jgi:hypothetical protein